MTDDERLQRVTTLMARRATSGPLLTVRADRLTRFGMTATCTAAVLAGAATIARHEPAAIDSASATSTKIETVTASLLRPSQPRAAVLRIEADDAAPGAADDGINGVVPAPDDLDAMTGGS